MANEKKEDIVTVGKLSDTQTVYTTKKVSNYYQVGTELTLHPVQAKAWIASGKATENPAEKATKKDKV